MRKATIVLTILLVFAVMVSGCASKAPTPAPATDSFDPDPKPSPDVNIPTNDIPAVTNTEGIAIEEPDLSAETDVDFGSVI